MVRASNVVTAGGIFGLMQQHNYANLTNQNALYPRHVKPAIDYTLAFIGLLISLPVTLLVTLLLYMANRGKPFFTQLRPGRFEQPFRIIKFKTMNDRRGADGELLTDAERLTPIGAFVRKTSLDELPQLLNVLRGELSLVGPRPLLMEYLPLYNAEQRLRHCVKPGITGWAQVNGRNAISWEEKFKLDVVYIRHISFAMDMRIMLKTIANVLVAKGINSATAATMHKFTGSTPRTDL